MEVNNAWFRGDRRIGEAVEPTRLRFERRGGCSGRGGGGDGGLTESCTLWKSPSVGAGFSGLTAGGLGTHESSSLAGHLLVMATCTKSILLYSASV